MTDRVRWGILGTGNIARQFAAGLAQSRRGTLSAVGSRTASTARAFADKFQVPRAHETYESLLADGDVDVIYNSLPNSLHCEWTIAALRAGKHVLCEKPLAMNAAEAQRMFEAADEAGRILMEAFMYRSHPLTLAVEDSIRGGAIGELRLIRMSFCYRTRKIEGNVRFDRPLGGGALMDIGCYCINFARHFARAEPASMQISARMHPAEVDEMIVGAMMFPAGIAASFTCGMCVQADNTAYLCGSEGFIEIPAPWKPPSGKSTYVITRGIPPRMDGVPIPPGPPPREVRTVDGATDLYGMEADDFAATVLDGRAARISHADSIGNMMVLDEMRRQIGLEF